ncbi:type II toxin-antitoxin system VapC family toxin [Ornithinimicrobium cerasi]|uniref:type II toxin-antitoxin system VapC family toxin n=1 Tax=Ornithinimicrobium cerasi TaxID=2248773 RepID=UPI000EFDDC66|nr:type II toxin-antitoxin system VapC family toxin [Ornithinimicrobium cerasi]
MSCVIDASVLVDLLTGFLAPEALPDAAAGQWHAPAHVDVEVLHALRGLVLGGHLSISRARDALRDLDDLQMQRWPLRHSLALRALDLGSTLTAYDAAYVVLAEGIDAPLITRDGRLARGAAPVSDVDVIAL